MTEEKVNVFEITNFDGFCESITNEAFSDSAIFVGKKFFKNKKNLATVFKKKVIERKEELIPSEKTITNTVNKFLFASPEHKTSQFIMPDDINFLISLVSNDITYNIMSTLTDLKILEMCYDPITEDVIWRLKK
jgi:hypothetical protein